MKRISSLIVLAAALLASPLFADGKIIVMNDEYPLSDNYWSTNAAQYAANIATYFGGPGGNFYADSNDFGLTGSDLAAQMTTSGETWHTGTAGFGAFTLANLEQYTAVFFSDTASSDFDPSILVQYVEAGGDVLIESGTGGIGNGSPAAEAGYWNPFLTDFGLEFDNSYNGIVGNVPISSSNPLFIGVTGLFNGNGQDISYTNPTDPEAQILVTDNGNGMYAVTDAEGPSATTPEPGSLLLLGSGLLGVGRLVRRKTAALAPKP